MPENKSKPIGYALASVLTDVHPEELYRFDIVRTWAEARDWLADAIANHAGPDAQAQQEAEEAAHRLARWHGEPTTFCGWLTRYEVYPLRIGGLTRDELRAEYLARRDREHAQADAERLVSNELSRLKLGASLRDEIKPMVTAIVARYPRFRRASARWTRSEAAKTYGELVKLGRRFHESGVIASAPERWAVAALLSGHAPDDIDQSALR